MPFPFAGLFRRSVTGPEWIRVYGRNLLCIAGVGKIDVGQNLLHIIDRAAVLRKQFLIALFDDPEAFTVSQMQAHFLQDLDQTVSPRQLQQGDQDDLRVLDLFDHLMVGHVLHVAEIMDSVSDFDIEGLGVVGNSLHQMNIR